MITLSLDELLAYTDEERGKWRKWFAAHPAAMDVRLQPEGRFATVGALIDHIFLVETRHLARLQKQPVPDASGVKAGDIDALFAYAARTRDGLRAYASRLDDIDAGTPREFTVQSGTARMTPRKLLFHIGLHELRHWAQISLGVRQSGLEPPGNHDLFYSAAME
jgi:uncharacterized damage-inducible protein DinB